jgi:hypothetical protein
MARGQKISTGQSLANPHFEIVDDFSEGGVSRRFACPAPGCGGDGGIPEALSGC